MWTEFCCVIDGRGTSCAYHQPDEVVLVVPGLEDDVARDGLMQPAEAGDER